MVALGYPKLEEEVFQIHRLTLLVFGVLTELFVVQLPGA
jgi:hypothetical protein